MSPKPTKPLTSYPEAIAHVERLHLLQQCRGAFPTGEPATLLVPDTTGQTVTGCWTYEHRQHVIRLANVITSHLNKSASGQPTALTVSRALRSTYEHERMHALFTSRDFEGCKKWLDDHGKIPFRVLNLLEDVRIESRAALRLALPFGDWARSYGLPPAPNGNPLDQMAPVNFALRWKTEYGRVAASDHRRGKGIRWARLWCGQALDAVVRNASSPWNGLLGAMPNGCTGTFDQAGGILTAAVGANSTEDLLPLCELWNRLFPMPASEEGERVPGETGDPESSPEGMPGEGAPSTPATDGPKGTFPEEVLESAEATAKEIARMGSSTSEQDADPCSVPRIADPTNRVESLIPAKSPASAIIDQRDRPFVEAWYPNARNCTAAPDAGTVNILRTAFPGTAGKRITSNPGGDVDLDRYITRTAEMFVDRKGPQGKKGDVIAIVDGSGSMKNVWREYGYQILTALIHLRNTGHLARLRLIVTGSDKCLMLTHPTLDDASRISPCAGVEGLWIAYEMMIKHRWIEEPQNTRILVLTDGCIGDDAPNRRAMNAAGVYPIGCYVGNHAAAPEKVGKFFDRFLVRKTLPGLLAELARVLT